MPDLGTRWRLRMAIDGAHRWLGNPACQGIFKDFEDRSGTSISDVLAKRGLTGQEQLEHLAFWDGADQRPCRKPGVVAATAPGYRIIYVCPLQFRHTSRNPDAARAVVIHEMLHSLGLGENPPASREITARILKRCRT